MLKSSNLPISITLDFILAPLIQRGDSDDFGDAADIVVVTKPSQFNV